MAGKTPGVLVVANERDERARIVSLLCGVGFAAVAVAEERQALSALRRGDFAIAVIALPPDRGIELMRKLRRRQPGLPMLLALEPDALPPWDQDHGRACATFVTRPFDLQHLLGRVLELVVRDNQGGAAPPRNHTAEYGIAAAKLLCLYSRLASAASNGALPLAHDLSKEIDYTMTVRDHLGVGMGSDRFLPEGAL